MFSLCIRVYVVVYYSIIVCYMVLFRGPESYTRGRLPHWFCADELLSNLAVGKFVRQAGRSTQNWE